MLYLIDHGGDASPASDALDTPLHCAAAQGQDRAVVRLLQKGADAHARNFQVRWGKNACVFTVGGWVRGEGWY